jgi:hypothetical protein
MFHSPNRVEKDLSQIAQLLTNLQRANERLLDFASRPAFKQDECIPKRHLKWQFSLNLLTIFR